MVHGKLHTSSSSNSSSSCHELESENEILKSQNAYLLSKVAAKSKVIKETREKCKEFQEKLYSVHQNSRKKVLRRNDIKSKTMELTEKCKLVSNLENWLRLKLQFKEEN